MADQEKPAPKKRKSSEPPKGRNRRRARQLKMDAARKQLFLDKLAEFGVAEWAAVQASPGATGSCISSFHDERKRDPEFAAAWDAAYDRGRMEVLGEAYRRATKGVPRLDKDGNVVGVQYSDSIMGMILKSKDFGSRFVDRQEVEHSGKITTKQELRVEDLNDEQRALLQKLLDAGEAK